MIENYSPAQQPSRIMRAGNPWHGIVESSTLTTTTGSISKAWPNQPDSGDAWLYKPAGLPTPTTPLDQQALGMEWRNSAVLSGWWERQLYGQELVGGNHAWVADVDGIGHSVHADLTISGGYLSGDVKLRPLTIPAGTTITRSVSLAVSDAGHWDIMAISPDGTTVYIGIWPATYDGNSVVYSQVAGCRGMAKLTYDSTQLPAGTHIAYAAPYQWAKIAIGTGATATLSMHRTTAQCVQVFTVLENTSDNGTLLGPCDEGGDTFYDIQESVYDWEMSTLHGISWTESGTEIETHMVVRRRREDASTTTMDCDDPDGEVFSSVIDYQDDYYISIRTGGTNRSTLQVSQGETGRVTTWFNNGDQASTTPGSSTYSMAMDGHTFSSAPALNVLATTDDTTSSTIVDGSSDGFVAHVVRWTNNAFSLVLVPYQGTWMASPYLGGVVNVLTGARGTATGTVTGTGDFVDTLYAGDEGYIAVDPYSHTLTTSETPIGVV